MGKKDRSGSRDIRGLSAQTAVMPQREEKRKCLLREKEGCQFISIVIADDTSP